MALIELSKIYPFTKWDAEKRRGETWDDFYITIAYETAKTKAGWRPFQVFNSGTNSLDRFSSIQDAVEYSTKQVHRFARMSGWTPEGETA